MSIQCRSRKICSGADQLDYKHFVANGMTREYQKLSYSVLLHYPAIAPLQVAVGELSKQTEECNPSQQDETFSEIQNSQPSWQNSSII